METGRIIKIISNQYTIQTPQRTVIAIPRGKLRREEKPVVGDIADFEEVEGSFRLDKVHPRKNRMVRPSVANVDQALIVQSLKDPDFSSHLLNRLMFLADLAGITPAICLTKSDALEPEELAKLKEIISWYEKAGYDVVYTHPGSDNDALRKLLEGKVTVLCGQTGAGKSSLLNRLDPTFQLHTQEISKALGRTPYNQTLRASSGRGWSGGGYAGLFLSGLHQTGCGASRSEDPGLSALSWPVPLCGLPAFERARLRHQGCGGKARTVAFYL